MTADQVTAPSAGPEVFRSLMSTLPAGVAVVTTADVDGTPWGLTCSTVCGVAMDPPTLLVCLRDESPTLHAMRRTSAFAVNLLHEAARDTAELFASGAADRFDRVEWTRSPHGASPHLEGAAHAIADCRITGTVGIGDHVVVFGEVLGVRHPTEDERVPLLYGFRRYSSWPVEP
ncbi:flavin reductase family protein [Umezawaea sp. NPDC059074]|uniref:flavin reductase family protein n=1 Tax=Umezawaea sp. NPDC059074 TaxID=3346716 RepID=UPI00369E6BA6